MATWIKLEGMMQNEITHQRKILMTPLIYGIVKSWNQCGMMVPPQWRVI
jgi:hypothetical protein